MYALALRAHDAAQGLSALGTFYLTALWIGALLLLLLVACVTLSSKAKRSAVWINLCVSFILYSLSLSLLFIVGKAGEADPSFGLCLTSAALIYSMPVLSGFATFTLVVHIWLDHQTFLSTLRGRQNRWKDALLVVLPYVACSIIIVDVILVGRRHPEKVERYGALPQCGIRGGKQSMISSVILFGILLVAIALQACIARSLWRIRRRVRLNSGEDGVGTAPVSSSVVVRLACFSLVTLFVLIATAARYNLPHSRDLDDGLICFMPLIMFLIFGTQRDILEGFAFWRRSPARTVSPTATELM